MRTRIILFLCLAAAAVFAQNPPQHQRLLYADSLTNPASTKMGSIINRGGKFIPGRGWEVTSTSSQLQVNLPADLPAEGTFIINVTNFDPAAQNADIKQNILSLSSSDDMFIPPQYETGSWWLYRTGTGYTAGDGMAGFRIDYACKGVDTRSDGRAWENATWSRKQVYEFKVIWTKSWIGFYVNNNLIMSPEKSYTPWTGQNEFFRYLFVGRDSKGGYPAMPGPIWFNARVYVPGPPLTMTKVSGDGQSAYTNNSLSDSLVVKISDDAGAGQANVPVTWKFTQGAGQIIETQPVLTNPSGLAIVHIKLGAQSGAYAIQASAEGATGSPATFAATATLPSIGLRKISGDGQTGQAGKMLPLDLVVKPVYPNGSGVANEPVIFRVVSGGTINGQGMVSVYSDAGGLAPAKWTLGPTAGAQKIIVSHGDSTAEFSATAMPSASQKIALVSGGGQSMLPGQPLPAPIAIRVSDEFNNSVPNQAVLFAVIAGNGHLGGLAQKNVTTDAGGNASVQWTMGPYRGVVQKLQITSSSSGLPLQGSPLLVQIDGGAVPDASRSAISATSPVIANGVNKSAIAVTVRDASGQPLAGYVVRLSASGTGNTLAMSDSLTNGSGQLSATLASLKAETKTITARIAGAEVLLAAAAAVVFEPVPQVAARIIRISGNNQSAIVGSGLADPFVVQVFDDESQPVLNYPVEFYLISGNANFSGQSQFATMTDAQGFARAGLTLGTTAGLVWAGARTTPVAAIVEFNAAANPAAAHQLTLQSGDGQSGAPGKALAAPIVAAVRDAWGNAVPGHPVIFSVTSGGGSLAGLREKSLVSDAEGRVSAYWTLGRYRGSSNRLEISSALTGAALQGSPISLEISENGLPALAQCQLTATTPVVADGAAFSDVTVTLRDQNGLPLAGFTVAVNAAGDDNLITVPDSLSDHDGKVRVQVRSRKAETKTITARIKGIELALDKTASVVFTTPPPKLDNLVYISGNEQTGRTNAPLPQPLIVRVLDFQQKPKGGTGVEFSIVAGGGRIGRTAKTVVLSDTGGYCSSVWTLGPVAGNRNNIGSAKIINATEPALQFVASASAGDPARWFIVSGNNQSGIVGQPLGQPLCILMQDAQDNPVYNLPVIFNMIQGDGGFPASKQATAITDGSGQARVLLTLGNQAVSHLVQVNSATAPLESLLFSAMANPEGAAKLIKVHGDSLKVEPDPGKSYELAARVTDRFGNPVPNVLVIFTAQDGGRITSQPDALSDSNGEVTCKVAPGPKPGTFHFEGMLNSDIKCEFSLFSQTPKINHAPIVTDFSPADTLARVNIGANLHFQFNSVIDPDGDGLSYEWRMGSTSVSTLPSLSLVVNATMPPAFTVTGIVSDGQSSTSLRWHIQVNPTTVEIADAEAVPEAIQLEQNYPNPFNSSTSIRFSLPARSVASLRIYSLSGQLVAALVNEELSAGMHLFSWQGQFDGGESAPSGIYYCELQAGAVRLTRKILLMR